MFYRTDVFIGCHGFKPLNNQPQGRTCVFTHPCGFPGIRADTQVRPYGINVIQAYSRARHFVDQDEMHVVGHTHKIVAMNAGKFYPYFAIPPLNH